MGDCAMIFLFALLLQAYIPLSLPELPPTNNSSSCALSAESAKCAHGLWLHRDVDVRHVLFRVGTVTAGDTIRVSLQYADANGLPTGTPLVSASIAITTAMANTWQEVTFSSAHSVTGTPRQLYIIYDYETYNGGNLNIVTASGGSEWRFISGSFNGTTWNLTGTLPSAFLRRADGSVVGLTTYAWIFTSFQRTSTNNPNEGGIACTFARAVRIVGIARMPLQGYSAINSVYSIYNGTSLLWSAESPAVDTTASSGSTWIAVMLGQPILARPGVEYIFAWRPTTTMASTILVSQPGFPPQYNDWFTAYSGGMCRLATRQYGGAWTFNSGTELWYVYPIIEEVLGGVQ